MRALRADPDSAMPLALPDEKAMDSFNQVFEKMLAIQSASQPHHSEEYPDGSVSIFDKNGGLVSHYGPRSAAALRHFAREFSKVDDS